MPAPPLGAFPFPRAGCQAVFRQANGKRGGFRTVMGRVGGGGASRPHRGVSAVLFGAEQLRLLDLPQRGRAGRKSRLMMMQLLCIMGKNTRYGGGWRIQRMKPVPRKVFRRSRRLGMRGLRSERFESVQCGGGSGGGRCQGVRDLQRRDAGGRPKG